MPHNYNTRNNNTTCSFDILLEQSDHKKNKKQSVKSPKKKEEPTKINLDAESENNLRNIIRKKILKHLLVEDLEDTSDDEIDYDEDEVEYYNSLPKQKRKLIDKLETQIENINRKEVPYRFQILSSKLPIETKSLLINKLDQFSQLDSSDSEYFKLSKWLDTFSCIPFGKYVSPPITNNDSAPIIKNFLVDTKNILDSVIYSHTEAKNEIIQYVCNSISNPDINGKVLAIQGPAGNGKTTLIKNGVASALKRPFGFIALGGAQDSSFLEGFDYTYEGSKCGKIIEILKKCKCMNPIIYFDELDKISDTPKGDEISNLLCHLIDPSQNNTFYDRYLSEIEVDLSKVIFIFSFNNEAAINPILKDRLKIIRTDGYNVNDKINIANKFLIPQCLENINLKGQINFEEGTLKKIISSHTNNEKGVRELKRNIEEICSKINLYSYLVADKISNSENEYNVIKKVDEKDDTKMVKFQIKNFKYPITVNDDLIQYILFKKPQNDSLAHIYM